MKQVGWKYPNGGFMHGMEWKDAYPEHVQHDRCVPVYILTESVFTEFKVIDLREEIGPRPPLDNRGEYLERMADDGWEFVCCDDWGDYVFRREIES